MSVLELKNVTKQFGGLTAISELNLSVERHQIHALIGPNGAGKTTVFNLITNVYSCTSGEILFMDKPINGLRSNTTIALGIARTFQNIRLFKSMSAVDNVMVGMHNKLHEDVVSKIFCNKKYKEENDAAYRRCFALMEYLGIADLAQNAAKNLPYGHQRLLEIARALASEPKLLLLDEPAAGMNKEERKKLIGFIRNIQRDFDISILLVEHDMELVMDIAEQITVVNYGKKIAEGPAEKVQNDPQVIEAYLGSRRQVKNAKS